MSDKLNLLYIDDEQDNLELYAEALGGSFNVLTTSNPSEIYTLLNDHIIQAVLVDIHMPLMDGFEVLKKIKAHPSGSKVCIFTFSSDETQAMKMKALSQGIDDHLFKTMDLNEVIQRIKNSLNKIKSMSNIVQIGNLQANFNSFQVFIDNKEVNLTLTEYKLMMCLVKANNLSTSIEEIKKFVYFQQVVSDNNFRVQLTNLRNKLSLWNHKISSQNKSLVLTLK